MFFNCLPPAAIPSFITATPHRNSAGELLMEPLRSRFQELSDAAEVGCAQIRIQMNVDKVQARGRSPVSQQPRFDVFYGQRGGLSSR